MFAGHSVGGTYAMVYAAEHPEDVAGLVLLDSASPHQFTALPDFPRAYAFLHRSLALLPTLQRLGAGLLLGSGPAADLPPAARAQTEAFSWTNHEVRGERDEVRAYPAMFEQAQALTGLGSAPLVVVTATSGAQAGWTTAQDALARLSRTSSHRLVPATHASLLLDPSDYRYSVAAIQGVVRVARTDTPRPASALSPP